MDGRRKRRCGRRVYTTALRPKLVLGENIAQTFQFAQSGAAEIGIVALALALAPAAREQGRYWEIPQDAYPKMEQAGVILTHAANPEGAREFRAFLMSDAGGGATQELRLLLEWPLI